MIAFIAALLHMTLWPFRQAVRATGDIGRSLFPAFYRDHMPHRSLIHSIFFFLVLLWWFELVRTGTFIVTNSKRIDAINVEECILETYQAFPAGFQMQIDTSSGHASIPVETTIHLPACVRDVITLGVRWLSHSNIEEKGIWASFANEVKLVTADSQLQDFFSADGDGDFLDLFSDFVEDITGISDVASSGSKSGGNTKATVKPKSTTPVPLIQISPRYVVFIGEFFLSHEIAEPFARLFCDVEHRGGKRGFDHNDDDEFGPSASRKDMLICTPDSMQEFVSALREVWVAHPTVGGVSAFFMFWIGYFVGALELLDISLMVITVAFADRVLLVLRHLDPEERVRQAPTRTLLFYFKICLHTITPVCVIAVACQNWVESTLVLDFLVHASFSLLMVQITRRAILNPAPLTTLGGSNNTNTNISANPNFPAGLLPPHQQQMFQLLRSQLNQIVQQQMEVFRPRVPTGATPVQQQAFLHDVSQQLRVMPGIPPQLQMQVQQQVRQELEHHMQNPGQPHQPQHQHVVRHTEVHLELSTIPTDASPQQQQHFLESVRQQVESNLPAHLPQHLREQAHAQIRQHVVQQFQNPSADSTEATQEAPVFTIGNAEGGLPKTLPARTARRLFPSNGNLWALPSDTEQLVAMYSAQQSWALYAQYVAEMNAAVDLTTSRVGLDTIPLRLSYIIALMEQFRVLLGLEGVVNIVHHWSSLNANPGRDTLGGPGLVYAQATSTQVWMVVGWYSSPFSDRGRAMLTGLPGKVVVSENVVPESLLPGEQELKELQEQLAETKRLARELSEVKSNDA